MFWFSSLKFALEHGWDELPNQETQSDQYAEEDWMLFSTLQQARLNVLERLGSSDGGWRSP